MPYVVHVSFGVEASCVLPRTPDSTVLIHIMTLLNARYSYGLDLFLLSVDEGITGYRDDSLEVRTLRDVGQHRHDFSTILSASSFVVWLCRQ
jgi:hypothetical protein